MQNICWTEICFTDSARFLSSITVLHIHLEHKRIACMYDIFVSWKHSWNYKAKLMNKKITLSEKLFKKDTSSWAGGRILSYKQLQFDWNLIPLRFDQNIEPST